MSDQEWYDKWSTIAENISKRYPKDYREELYSVGITKAWEYRLDEEPVTIGQMRRAVHDEYTLKRGPLSVPAGTHSRALYKALSSEGYVPCGPTEKALYEATHGVSEAIEPNTIRCHDSSEDLYAIKELREKLEDFTYSGETTKKRGITLRDLYLEDLSHEEVSERMGVSVRRVRALEAGGIKDFKDYLNVLH